MKQSGEPTNHSHFAFCFYFYCFIFFFYLRTDARKSNPRSFWERKKNSHYCCCGSIATDFFLLFYFTDYEISLNLKTNERKIHLDYLDGMKHVHFFVHVVDSRARSRIVESFVEVSISWEIFVFFERLAESFAEVVTGFCG